MACIGVFIELFIPEYKFLDQGALRENMEQYIEGVKRVTLEALEKTNTMFIEKSDKGTVESEFHKVSYDGRIGYWIIIVGFCDSVIAKDDKGWFVLLMVRHFNLVSENINLYSNGQQMSKAVKQ